MAQIVEIIGVGPVEFPDGMSKDEMAAALKKLPKPTTAQPESVETKPTQQQPAKAAAPAQPQGFNVLEASGAALMRQEAARQAKKQAEIPFEELYSNPENMKKIQDYATSRFGKSGQSIAGESAEDYVKRWATHMRMVSTGNLISSTQELQYLNNAKDVDKLKAKEAYDLFDQTAGYFSSAGQKGIKPVFDVLGSIVSDPTTAISVGAGKLATSAFMKQATKTGVKQAVKTNVGKLAAVPAIEATGAAASDVAQQKIELTGEAARLKQLEEILPTLTQEDQARFTPDVDALRQKVESGVSGKRVAASAALGAALGTAETALLIKGGKAVAGKGAVAELDELLKQRVTKTTAAPEVKVTKEDPTMKAVEDEYDIFEGRKLLDAQGQPTSVAEMQIRNDVNQQAAKVAKEVWARVPELAPQADQKVSDAVKNVFMNIDKIDNIVLEDSLAKAGITAEEFARMNRTTVGDAGRTLQAYSVLARIQNKLKSIDPAAAKEVDAMYGNRGALTSAFSGLRDGAMRLDRELKALMVSQVATTIRNGFSGAAVVTLGSASEAIESVLYRVGKSASEAISGKPVTGTFTGGLKGVYDDAVRTAFYLGQNDLSSEVAERLLAGSPALQNKILKTVGEADSKDLSKVAQVANTLNVAQDAFFRKAIFTASVEKQLSRVGIDMYDVMAQGKTIPFDVLRNATDEALAATFSKMPTKGPMFHAVKFVEELGPIGSTLIPFPRFMANAMTWTYKHSPAGLASGTADIAKGATLLKGGDETGTKYIAQGLENVSKGTIGTAAIYAAYKYRQEHQDTAWYDAEGPDGSKVDMRALFPLAPFMAMGDWLVKFEKGRTDEFKTKEFIEAMTGFKAPAGTYSWLGDKFTESLSNMQTGEGSADQKIATFFGEWAGEYLGRAFVPLAQVSDIIGAIDRDETLPRDAYQIPQGEEGFGTSFQQQIMKRTPVVKQQLPVYQPALREEAAFNDAGPLKMLSGIAVKGKPSELESEVERLKIDFNKVFTTTGDKVIDAAARKTMAPLIMDVFDQVKNTDYYQTASQDAQKIALQNLLGWAQRNAKEIATNKDMAAVFDQGGQSRIFSVKYSKLPAEVKRETAAFYKENTGQDLETTKDYMSALAMAESIRKRMKFAVGGVVSDIIGKAAGSAIKKSSADLLKEMQQAATKKAVAAPAPSAVMDQTANMLMGKKPVLPKSAAKPTPALPEAAAKPPEAPVLSQTEQALPTPPTQTIEAPTPSKAFADEDYVMGEELMKEQFDADYLTNWKIANPNDYANTLHSYTGQAKGLKTSEMPPPPFAAKIDDTIEYDMAGNEIKQGVYNAVDEVDDQLIKFERVNGVEDGDLNKKFTKPKALNNLAYSDQMDVTEQRNNILMSIKQDRKEQFKQFRKTKDLDMFDDEVLAVMQGDFRVKNDRELNFKTDREAVLKLATDYQKQLDDLRVKYKDTPPVKLYHGGMDVDGIKSKGFYDPQSTTKNFHQEMFIGAPSFTRDLNFNFTREMYGGTTPSNFVYTEVPYADYVFTKVKMTPANYDAKDLNTIAQSINGSSYVARPVSLPRASFYEKEDMFPEANKLIVKDASDNIEKLLSAKPTGFGGRPNPKAIVTPDALKEATKQTTNIVNDAVNSSSGKEAYFAYNSIRDLMQKYASMGANVQTKGGIGQQYAAKINTFSDMYPKINKIVNILESSGAKQRAENLKSFTNLLEKYNDISGDAAEEAARVKELNAIFEFVPKLAKGGLASRR